MGEMPAAMMWSVAVLCGRSEEISKRGNSLLCCEHPLFLPWQCGQSARHWWVWLALLSSSASTESSVDASSCLHPAGVRPRVVPELQSSLWAFNRP